MIQTSSESGSTGLLQVHRDALAQGIFLIQQCRECGRHAFYPRELCPHCGSPELKWVEPSGRAVVYAVAVLHQGLEKNIATANAENNATGKEYSIAQIELEEGPRMLARVMDVTADKLRIGMPVSAHIGMVDGQREVVFYNKEQGSREW